MSHIWVWQEEQGVAFIDEARQVLAAGGVLAVPTETYYALAVNPFNEIALARVFGLKARPPDKPVLVLIPGPEMLTQVAARVPEDASRLMTYFWPGPLTLILPASPGLPVGITAGTGTVGVRQLRQPQVCRLMKVLGLPITGTSANRSGQPPLVTAAEVAAEFGAGVDLILDTGSCPGGPPSSIVDVSSSPPRLVRAGAVPTANLREVLGDMRT